MSIDLSSAWSKFGRAQHHLQALDSEIRRYLDSQPYEVIEKVDTDARDPFGWPAIDHAFRVWVKRECPPEWELVVGDCLHNLRCVLDHLAWTLAGSSSNDSKTQFPIFESLGMYEKFAEKQTALIPDELRAIIKELQPFKASPSDPRRDALWVLHELERIDKHRRILVVSTATTTRYGRLNRKIPGLITGYDMLAGNTPFQHGALIARYNLTFDRDERPPPDVEMDMAFSFDMAFDPVGPARGEPVIESLNKLSTHVAQVLKLFEDS